MSCNLSLYAEKLHVTAKMRYVEKINGGENCSYKFPDPYDIHKSQWKDEIDMWPSVEFGDIYIYLKSCNSTEYDDKTLKNYKSLSAYKYVTSGKVQQVLIYAEKSNQYCLLTAEVQRSMSVNDKNHQPWVIVSENGSVDAAHCTCMAGLGEACSHVAALLFKIEMGKARNDLKPTPTDLPCVWNRSFSSKKVQSTTVDNLELSKCNWMQKQKRRKIECPKSPKLPPFSGKEKESLRKAFPNSVYVSLFESDSSTDSADDADADENMPPTLIQAICRFKGQNLKTELKEIFNSRICQIVLNKTSGQSSSSLWFEHRRGRFTSSNFKTILRRKNWDEEFAKKIIENEKQISSVYTDWGKKNEATALECYTEQMLCQHTNFSTEKCGLYINPSMPHLAATPDALCKCDCCGGGIIEIKCPFKHRDSYIKDVVDKAFCLDEHGMLKKNHMYFYQVQGQLAIAQKEFCDFVLWTTVDMHVQRIYLQTDFWDEQKEILDDIFYSVMVPVIQKTSRA